jgi:hypothetical protein
LVGHYPTNYLIRRGPIPGRKLSPKGRIRCYLQFPAAIPDPRAGSHVLLTRPPLTLASASDLHVLGAPPAFVLSQDQTLSLIADHLGSRKVPIRNPKGSPMNTKMHQTIIPHPTSSNPKATRQQRTPPAHPSKNASLQSAPPPTMSNNNDHQTTIGPPTRTATQPQQIRLFHNIRSTHTRPQLTAAAQHLRAS